MKRAKDNDSDKDSRQAEHIEERSTPRTPVIYDVVRRYGEEEMARPAVSLWWSGLAAGLSMSFSLLAEAILRMHIAEYDWQRLIVSLGYPVGFVMVVLGRQQLFTENTLTVVLPLLHRRDAKAAASVARLWAVVLAGNLVGALAIAWVVAHTGVFDEEAKRTFSLVALEGTGAPFGLVLLRGIFAGWLIALMVWLMPGAEVARIWIIILLTYVIALGGFAHVIAGSVDKLFLVWTGHMSVAGYLGGFLLPSFLGNVIGGVSLVAALNHVAAAPGHARN